MHHRNERKQAREAKHFTAYEAAQSSAIEEADAMAERKCDNCAHRGPWRAEYSRVPVGPQAFAVADCPHAYDGRAGVTPSSGTHCPKFTPRATGVQATASPEDRRLAAMFAGDDDSLVAVQNEGGKP